MIYFNTKVFYNDKEHFLLNMFECIDLFHLISLAVKNLIAFRACLQTYLILLVVEVNPPGKLLLFLAINSEKVNLENALNTRSLGFLYFITYSFKEKFYNLISKHFIKLNCTKHQPFNKLKFNITFLCIKLSY